MKYEFKKIGADTTELIYKDKKFTIKRDVGLMKDIQSAIFKAKRKMVFDLAKEGLTKDDLVIKKQEENKTYEDNTNVVALEEEYTNEATMEMFDGLCKKFFNMGLMELATDIGLEDTESELFGMQLMSAFTGSGQEETTPRDFAKTLQ